MISPTSAKGAVDVEQRTPGDNDAEMTSQQADVLRALCEEQGEEFQPNLTQAQAEKRIAELQAKS